MVRLGSVFSPFLGNSGGRYSPLPNQSPMVSEKSQSGNAGPNAVEAPPSRAKVFASVSFYLVAALVMIMVNKWVLNAVSVPLFFLLVQLLVAVVLLHITAWFGFFKIPEIRATTVKGLVPLLAINCIGLAFNTYCLQYVDASFYQVARGLILPFTTALSYVYLGQTTATPILGSIGVVCLGFVVGVSQENFSVSGLGIALGVLSSVTTAGHAIAIKKALPVVNGSAMDLAYFSNFLSAFVIGPAAILFESGKVVDMLANPQAFHTFWVGSLVTGVFGFLICIAGFVSIKVTSPITHMMSAAVRGVIQTGLGVWLFKDVLTQSRASGIGLILGGSILYTYLKDKELTRATQAAKMANNLQLSQRSDTETRSPRSPPEIVFDMHDGRRDEDRALLEADELIAEQDKKHHGRV